MPLRRRVHEAIAVLRAGIDALEEAVGTPASPGAFDLALAELEERRQQIERYDRALRAVLTTYAKDGGRLVLARDHTRRRVVVHRLDAHRIELQWGDDGT